VSVVANIAEGSARPTERDYLHFVAIALGSATETRYLVGLAARLRFMDKDAATRIASGYERVCRALQGLSRYLSSRSPQSAVRSP